MALTPTKQKVPIDMGLLEILNQKFEQLVVDPVVLTEGRVWQNTTDHKVKRIEDGVIVPFFSAADAVKLAEYQTIIDQAEEDIAAANSIIESITSNNILSKYEKAVIKSQYDLLIAEQVGIDEIATLYGITTEKTTYDDSITALTAYLVSLDPLYTDYTQDTVIDGALFRQLFADIYAARQLLANAMSDYAHTTLDNAMAIANDAKAVADNAAIAAAEALASIGTVISDGLLARIEKPGIVQEYNILITEQTGLDAQATAFDITTEKTAYDDAVTALTVYITGLTPAYNDYSQETEIVRSDFNDAFELVFSTRQILLNTFYAAAKLLADNAAIIARSKGKHFISEPTTPYYVGDIYTNEIDLYRCIVERLTGAYNAADWEPATHYDRTQVIMDSGMITAGRLEVGGGALNTGNAGINGSVSGIPTTDIRFWAGANYANRSTASWRVQDNGEFWGTKGHIGGWTVDADSLFSGTKVSGNGFAGTAGDMTIKSNGSLHTKNFYIDSDGTFGFGQFASIDFTVDGATNGIKMQGGEIRENANSTDWGFLLINYNGYNGGTSKYKGTHIGDGRGNIMMKFDPYNSGSGTKEIVVYEKTRFIKGINMESTADGLVLPHMTTVQRRANIVSPVEAMMVYNTTTHRINIWNGTNWQYFDEYGNDD